MGKKIFGIMAGTAALLGGIASSPAGQQVVEQVAQEGPQVIQKAPAQRVSSQSQQAQSRIPGKPVRLSLVNPYAPFGGLVYGGNYGMSPKDYGEYLIRSGKNKYNKRCRQHWAKMHA